MLELIGLLSGANTIITEVFKQFLQDSVDERVNDTQRKRLTLIFSIVFGWITMGVLVFGFELSFSGYDLGIIANNDYALIFLVGGLSSQGARFFHGLLEFLKGVAKTQTTQEVTMLEVHGTQEETTEA